MIMIPSLLPINVFFKAKLVDKKMFDAAQFIFYINRLVTAKVDLPYLGKFTNNAQRIYVLWQGSNAWPPDR